MPGRVPPTESFGRHNASSERRDQGIRDALRIDGSQFLRLYEKMQALFAGLETTVTNLVQSLTYTTSEIDNKVANPGNIAPGNVTASGEVSGNHGTFPGGINSVDVHSRLVTFGGPYTATWTHQNGTMGTAPSSERFKQDIVPADVDVTALERAAVVQFRYIAAVDNLGDDAEVTLGGTAEQFIEAGLGHTVTLDKDGQPFSIEDRPLLYTLLAGYQALARRVAELEAQTPNPNPQDAAALVAPVTE